MTARWVPSKGRIVVLRILVVLDAELIGDLESSVEALAGIGMFALGTEMCEVEDLELDFFGELSPGEGWTEWLVLGGQHEGSDSC